MRFSRLYSIFKRFTGQLYGNKDVIHERHRHRYEVNIKYVQDLEKNGMEFVAVDEDKNRMEIFELRDHPYYVGVQFHPEYRSRPLSPSPPFVGLILAGLDRLKSYLVHGCKLSPHGSDYYDSDDICSDCSSTCNDKTYLQTGNSDNLQMVETDLDLAVQGLSIKAEDSSSAYSSSGVSN